MQLAFIMTYSFTSSACLDRLKARMDEGSQDALVYAALELRFGVEARLREYIETIEHIPKAQKKEWEVAKLGRSLQSAYRTGDKIMIFTIHFPEDGAELRLLYTPVTKRLQDIAKRLGNILHVPRETQPGEAKWWKTLRALLDEGFPLLTLANSGELIGLPLLHRPTGRITTHIVMDGSDSRSALVSRLSEGAKHVLSVAYMDPIPDTFTFNES